MMSFCLSFFSNNMRNSKDNERENKKYLNNFIFLYI